MPRIPLAILPLLALLLALTLSASSPASSAGPFRLFLPMSGGGPARGVLGVEIASIDPRQGLAGLGAGWVRRNGLRWRDLEPTPGEAYRWDAPEVQALEAQLRAAATIGLRPILVLQASPAWAIEPFTADCAPINPRDYAAFARFAAAAVRRYSAPPFNVRHWELTNEPDAFVFTVDSPFGCWGRTDQELYGGQAYGELLKVAYPAIKAADPEAVVIHGGLLLDAPYEPATGRGRVGRFLEGVLAAGAGDSFDVLAFHSYSTYDGTPDGTLGPQDWKPAYLRAILARYGLSKPLFNSEGALLCPAPSPDCAQAQAYAMGRLGVRALRDTLTGLIWYLYENDGFRNTALVEPDAPGVRRPAYTAFAQASRALAGHSYAGALAGLPRGVEGHRLVTRDRATLVLWANIPTQVRLELGAGAAPSCTGWDGAALACAADQGGILVLEAGPGPLYIALGAR